MKRKVMIALFLCLILLFTAACGNTQTAADTSGESASTAVCISGSLRNWS